jgi:hypothetical protein
MSKRIYTVVLQSGIGDGQILSLESFFYDWSLIPDVPYYVRFSFASSSNPVTQTGQMAMLYVDLAQSNNQIATAQSSAQYSYRSQFLGNLMYATVGGNTNLYAENNTNPPTYLNGRPRRNNFTVEICNAPTTYFTPFSGTYCLILSFQEC